jgi:hypothetical protein
LDSNFPAKLENSYAQYQSLKGNGLSVMARRKQADHGQMLYNGNGYMTAWFRYLLTQDSEAARAFVGSTPEISRNPDWQDVNIKNSTN